MEIKKCTKCGRELPLDNFHWRNKAKGTRRSECKDCHNGQMHENYLKKKEQVNKIKQELGCQKCGYNKCLEVLEFHHKNPQEKETTIAQMIYHHYSQEQIKQEMDKCVILCANCHREFHFYEKTKGITLEQFWNLV